MIAILSIPKKKKFFPLQPLMFFLILINQTSFGKEGITSMYHSQWHLPHFWYILIPIATKESNTYRQMLDITKESTALKAFYWLSIGDLTHIILVLYHCFIKETSEQLFYLSTELRESTNPFFIFSMFVLPSSYSTNFAFTNACHNGQSKRSRTDCSTFWSNIIHKI